ncbi:UbiA family prenyltransferase [Azorhizophilus paspali]|uniref:UbiA family prenyltransferase n=1 Tax=Azorhizophilus paspali TaxID=69963 RepID=A0ABV6SR20_AZOPA
MSGVSVNTIKGSASVPLCVDLDGTLLCSDLLYETGMAFLRKRPFRFYQPFVWLAQGKPALKQNLAHVADIDVSVLPYNQQVIDLIDAARQEGRSIVLATASHHSLAERIADHLKLFDMVLATDSERNLSARCKHDLLVKHFGPGGFDYVGNSRDDLHIWEGARRSYVVDPEKDVEKQAKALGNVEQVIKSDSVGLRDWARALRLHQWAKNVLVFVPLLAAHQLTNPALLWNGILAFLLFGLCASSVYLLNDLLDLADDRHHHSKRNRPFAAGRLSIKSGLVAFPVLLLTAFTGALWLLPWQFTGALGIYYVLTLAYSLALKRYMAVDVIALALLYTIRIIAGAMAFGLEMTFWMLAFSMFIFLSLALVKRYAELHEAKKKGRTEKTRGRGYYPSDLEMISSLGAAAGYLAVMVLALYIHDQTTIRLYAHPHVMWLACPLLLFWVSRVWMLAHRGEMHDDPVVFAVKDRASLVVGMLFCLVFWGAA